MVLVAISYYHGAIDDIYDRVIILQVTCRLESSGRVPQRRLAIASIPRATKLNDAGAEDTDPAWQVKFRSTLILALVNTIPGYV